MGMKKVGKFLPQFNNILGIDYPCLDIMQSGGLKVHVQKRHPEDVCFLEQIERILQEPDFIGINPNVENSIELVKNFSDHVQVAVKLDVSEEYFYVASLYTVKPSKITQRLYSGRLKKFKK